MKVTGNNISEAFAKIRDAVDKAEKSVKGGTVQQFNDEPPGVPGDSGGGGTGAPPPPPRP